VFTAGNYTVVKGSDSGIAINNGNLDTYTAFRQGSAF
jgi:hypothetical protein